MKVGSIGYATHQGLGILLKSFYDHGIVTDVATIRHWKHVNHNWYEGPSLDIRAAARGNVLQNFARQMDVMMFFETPFDLRLIDFCEQHGIPTILMPMYECTPNLPVQPDLIINPSLLDQEYFPEGIFTPIPVDDHIKWKQRGKISTFVHNAGHLGLNGRNGTLELLQAMKYVKSPVRVILRSQDRFTLPKGLSIDDRIFLRQGTVPKEELYQHGEAFVFPEKFNGLSLPLQEAFAAGMLVMSTDRFPMNTWLPTAPLIPTYEEKPLKKNLSRQVIESVVSPKHIAETMDQWYGSDVSKYSRLGLDFKHKHSWERLGPMYKGILERVVCTSP